LLEAEVISIRLLTKETELVGHSIHKSDLELSTEITAVWVTNVLSTWGSPFNEPHNKAGEYDAKRVGEFFKGVYRAIQEAYRDSDHGTASGPVRTVGGPGGIVM
jgi:hypothetical protein